MQQQQHDYSSQPSRWNEMKQDLGKNWNKISPTEWENTHGDKGSMSSILQERYGMSETDAESKLRGVLGKYGNDVKAQTNNADKTNQNDPNRKIEREVPRANQFGKNYDKEQNLASHQTSDQNRDHVSKNKNQAINVNSSTREKTNPSSNSSRFTK